MRNPLSHLTLGLVSGAALMAAFGGAGSASAQLRLLSDGPQIELRDLAARVVVTPEARNDIDIHVKYGKAKVPVLMVSHRGNVTILNGHINDDAHNDNIRINFGFNTGDGGNASGNVFIDGLGDVAVGELPLVYIRVPMNAVVKDSAITFGHIGPSNSLDFILNGSGTWSIDPVNGPLNVIDSGSGDITIASAGDSVIDNMGSSEIHLGKARSLKASLSGSGDFTSGQSSDTWLQNNGSGDVNLGHVNNLQAQLNGSGDLQLDSVNGTFNVTNNGSSDVKVVRVMGPAALSLSGSGDLTVDGGQIPSFILKGSGSGDVDFGGVAGVVQIDTQGSGDVSISKAVGQVTSKVNGSGEMHIGH